ncbi:MAG TPA: L-glutamate gamma-semialdehyde dehydrogenase [Bacteroidales bacterium]|nr:L-glutamate gamma-semialdehyde dehydrogenase [Bacteroidales bacterium]HNS46244.1 L-glutamate gamma-semialdehyde dehydrogenase [Bacteroidales bacterium]
MNNALYAFEYPENEPIRSYVPGSRDRKGVIAELKKMSNELVDIPLIIGGKEIRTGDIDQVVMPHRHQHQLAVYHKASPKEVKLAVEAALKAHRQWESMFWVERLSIMLKIAELVATKYRPVINAATMLGQSKSIFQAEIDAACETIDFLRFNGHYISDIYNEQPHSEKGIINRIEYRPLEGFVFAVTPFNFTSIASNLNLAPALMGNTLIWKPASTSLLSNYYLMKIFQEAGLPDGVVNFIPGPGSSIGNAVMADRHLAGVHFTGSNATFNRLWKMTSEHLSSYKSYPMIVGETGGKDFVFVHTSADPEEVATALIRGAFEYQGQKCSAASRAYIPESLWKEIRERLTDMHSQIKMGDPADFENFMNAVIDKASFDNIMGYIHKAEQSADTEVILGGKGDHTEGFFIEPTIILTRDPHFLTMEEEIFGPVLTIFVYKDDRFEETLHLCDETSPYGLTGSIFARDRYALTRAGDLLKYAAGNLYYNDKPTGAVVGQQPFGGSRQSGTNDKAGSFMNLLRWTNPRTIKENLLPATDFKYPFMKKDQCQKE